MCAVHVNRKFDLNFEHKRNTHPTHARIIFWEASPMAGDTWGNLMMGHVTYKNKHVQGAPERLRGC